MLFSKNNHQVLPSLSLDGEGVIFSLCWTTDLDYFFHMNNGKYFSSEIWNLADSTSILDVGFLTTSSLRKVCTFFGAFQIGDQTGVLG